MKAEDLKHIYPVPKTAHDYVLSVLDTLDDKSPKVYKKRKAIKIALVCAVIAIISATAVVASATNLFGLFSKSVGKYGMNVTVYDDIPADKINVKLKLGYIPNGYKPLIQEDGLVDENTYTYNGDYISKKDVFIFNIIPSASYEHNETHIVDSFETQYNGHKTIIMTRQFEENGDKDYIAVEHFEDFGYVVECYTSNYNELLSIMEKLELQEIQDYTEITTVEKVEPTEEGYGYSYNTTDTFTFVEVGESFDWSDLVINGIDEVPEFAKSADNFTVKVKSIEETDNCNNLNDNGFLYNGNEEFKANFFDENGMLITPYTRTDRNNGDGINSLDQTWQTTDDRRFYIVTLDVTSNTEYTDLSINGSIWASAVNETDFADEYGDVSLVYVEGKNEFNQIEISKGETKEIKIGVIADEDVAKYACLTFETTNRNVSESDESVNDIVTYTCIKLNSEVDYD